MRTFALKPERKSKSAQQREDRAVYEAVAERSAGMCEGCGERRATDMHHRLYRSRGGTTSMANVIHLCGGVNGLSGGNHSGCHGTAHTILGEQLGWSVITGKDPAQIPVFCKGTQSWTLNGEPILAATACELMAVHGQLQDGLRE